MGPRPFSRGNAVVGPSDDVASGCFNGAATFQPRKHRRDYRERQRKGGFNGAATFQPRKQRRRIPAWRIPVRLQWGRDLSAAETRTRKRPCTRFTRFNGAATFQPRKHGPRRMSGGYRRGFNGAATFQPRKLRVARENRIVRACFNGAATFQPRKQGENQQLVNSWSSFNGAATFQPRKRCRPAGKPHRVFRSMGPRPFSRGNGIDAAIQTAAVASMGPRPQPRKRRKDQFPNNIYTARGRDLQPRKRRA